MEIRLTGKNIEITDAIRSSVEEKLSKLSKYLEDVEPVHIDVLVKAKSHSSKGEPRETVEVTMRAADQLIRCEETEADLYAAIDAIEDKLERKLRAHKERLIKERRNERGVDEKEIQKIVKRKSLDVGQPISEDEAITRMDLLGHDFYIFIDKDTMQQSVVYKRKDGGYGMIAA